jgi:integrase
MSDTPLLSLAVAQIPSKVKVDSGAGDKCGMQQGQMLQPVEICTDRNSVDIVVSSTPDATPTSKETYEKKLLELQELFLNERANLGAALNTLHLFQRSFVLLNQAHITLDDFNNSHLLEKFAHGLPESFERSTAIMHLGNCATFGNWLAQCHYTSCRHHAPNRKRRPKRRDVLTETEVETLLKSLRQRAHNADFFRQTYERDWLIISVLHETGARVSEVIDICVDDLLNNEHGNFLIIKGTKTEDSERTVDISDELFISLSKYRHTYAIARGRIFRTRTGNRIDRVGVGHWLKKYARSLNLSVPVTPHLFRYQFIMRKITEGMSALELMSRLGHGGVDMTVYYFNQVRRLMPWVKTNPDIAILERRIAYWKKESGKKGGNF